MVRRMELNCNTFIWYLINAFGSNITFSFTLCGVLHKPTKTNR
jgi:hypothetical protein